MSTNDDGETASNFGVDCNYDRGLSSLKDPLLKDYKPVDDVPTEQNLEVVNSVERKSSGEVTGKIF